MYLGGGATCHFPSYLTNSVTPPPGVLFFFIIRFGASKKGYFLGGGVFCSLLVYSQVPSQKHTPPHFSYRDTGREFGARVLAIMIARNFQEKHHSLCMYVGTLQETFFLSSYHVYVYSFVKKNIGRFVAAQGFVYF